MKKKFSDSLHVSIIIIGLLGSFNNNESLLELLIISVIAVYEVFILILSHKRPAFNHFIFLWRLFLGISLFFPMLPIAIIIPEYHSAIMITDVLNLESLIVFEVLASLFWFLAVINYLSSWKTKLKIYFITYLFTISVLIPYWIVGYHQYIGLVKSIVYLVWIIIFIIEINNIRRSTTSVRGPEHR